MGKNLVYSVISGSALSTRSASLSVDPEYIEGSTLVTGAAGFIGNNLVRELLRKSCKVRAMVKPGESDDNLSDLKGNKNLEIVYADLQDKSKLKKVCRGIDIVFHLAAKRDLSTQDYRPYFETNVAGTKNLVRACDKKLRHFIAYSSILATGLPNTSRLLDESFEGPPGHFYGRSKKEMEDFLLKEYRERGFPVTIFRPTTVYGPYELMVQYFLFKTIAEGRFFLIGKGNNLNSYVYVGNLVDATIQAASTKETLGQVYFINDRTPYKFRDIVNLVYKAVGKKPPEFYVPFIPAYVGAGLYAGLCRLIGKEPVIYPSRVKTMVLNYAYSVKKAEKDFGYNPKYDLQRGIKETFAWYKNNGYLR